MKRSRVVAAATHVSQISGSGSFADGPPGNRPHSDGRGPARPSLRQTVGRDGRYLDGINKFAPAGELPPVVVAALGPKTA
jgi:hypothetical protein